MECGCAFTYAIKRGTDRRYCSPECRSERRQAVAKAQPLCTVEGCKNPRAYKSGICNACYCRVKRTGTLERRVWKRRYLLTNGYVGIGGSQHELTSSNGYLLEHRQVLFDAIGYGPHSCHWCAKPVDWVKGPLRKGHLDGVLVPDHLDGDKTNNVLANLVPACHRRNLARGSFMKWVHEHKDDPILWAMYQAARLSA